MRVFPSLTNIISCRCGYIMRDDSSDAAEAENRRTAELKCSDTF